MSRFNADILGRLSEATPAELNAALAAIAEDGKHFAAQAASTENVAALNDLIAAGQAITAELAARPDPARPDPARLAADQAAALAAIAAFTADADTEDDKPAEGDDGETEEDGEQAAPAEPNQPGTEVQETVNAQHEVTAEETAAAGGQTTEEGGNVTASARRPLGGGGVKPSGAPARVLPSVRTRTYANAGVAHTPSGEVLDRESVWSAFAAKLRGAGHGNPGHEVYPLITQVTEFPDERHLPRGASALSNMEKVEAVVDAARSRHARDNTDRVTVSRHVDGGSPRSLVAAGLCAPLENLYDIRVIGDEARPVRDALVRFGADRGGIQYRPAMDGVSQTGGIGVWTTTNDEAGPLVPKTCVEIACPGLVTAEVEAIYACLTFSNMSTRFDPEGMDAVVRSQRIAHDRFAENRLITQLTTGSKDVYSTQVLGAVRDVLATLDHMVAYYRSVHRLADETPLRWIAPLWTKYLMRADMVRQMVGDGMEALALTDARLTSWLSERNINVTWHLDGIDPADLTVPTPDVVVPAQFYTSIVDEGAVPGFPNAISTLLFAEGDWLYLDGGSLDMGVVRDSTLNGLNRFQTFSEEFGFPAFRGIESLHLVIQANPTGQSAATKDTSAIAD